MGKIGVYISRVGVRNLGLGLVLGLWLAVDIGRSGDRPMQQLVTTPSRRCGLAKSVTLTGQLPGDDVVGRQQRRLHGSEPVVAARPAVSHGAQAGPTDQLSAGVVSNGRATLRRMPCSAALPIHRHVYHTAVYTVASTDLEPGYIQ